MSSLRLRIDRTWEGAPAPEEAVTLTVTTRPGDDLGLEIDAPFHGDPPPPHPAGSTPGLWEHEVVELFVAGEGEPLPYTEIEVGPHGHHLVLRLEGVRRVVASGLPLDIEVRRNVSRWQATAIVARDLLPPPPWRFGAFALHGQGAGRRHLSLVPLPGDRPDFHRPETFLAADELANADRAAGGDGSGFA